MKLSCRKAFSSPWQVVMKYVNLATIYLGSGKMPETLQTMLISIFELILSLRQKSFPFGCHHCGVLYEKKKKNGAGFLELSEYCSFNSFQGLIIQNSDIQRWPLNIWRKVSKKVKDFDFCKSYGNIYKEVFQNDQPASHKFSGTGRLTFSQPEGLSRGTIIAGFNIRH